MSTHARAIPVSLDEYLSAAESSESRSEYVDGQVVAMGGSTMEHGSIVQSIGSVLYAKLTGGPCKVHSQGTFIKVERTQNVFLPDVVVFCGDKKIERGGVDMLLNPVVLVEVLSPSTADYDHGKKWADYRQISSLQDYVLVYQDEPRVERYTRHGEGFWLFSETTGLEGSIRLDSIGAELALSEVYRDVLPGGSATA
jgi:Uma2 family endonuclease